MKKILLAILLTILLPFTVNAEEPIFKLQCPTGGVINSTLKCELSVITERTVNEVSLEYDFEDKFTYESFVPASNFTSESATSSGFTIKNATGMTGEFEIGVLSVKFLQAGNMGLKNIKIVDNTPSTFTAPSIAQPIAALSGDNTLKTLTFSSGELSPKFDASITNYKLEVEESSITITATANDTKAKVSGTGKKNLAYGDNIINVVVVSESGSKKTYKITVTRKDNRNANNNIKSLTLSIGTFSFTPETTSYIIPVQKDVEKVQITAELEDSKASFVKNYGPREIQISGEKTVAELKVKSESEVVKVYTLTFVKTDKVLSDDNTIKELTIEGYEIDFKSEVTTYELKVKENDTLKFKILLNSENAKYELINSDLKDGNTVIIKVTAENGDIREYKFNLVQEKSEIKSIKEDLVCNDNSIIYYLIFFVLGLIIATIISNIVYNKKIKKIEKKYRSEINQNYIPNKNNEEVLFYDDYDQNIYRNNGNSN